MTWSNLSKYISYADNAAEELRSSLTEEDVELLRTDLEQLGVDAWLDWADQHRRESNDYLEATEKQRARLKKWRDPVLRRRMILCAYHQARLAASVMDAAGKLMPGGSYREMTAYAATIGNQVIHDGSWRWPFIDVEPPTGWPEAHQEPWITTFVSMPSPGQPIKPPQSQQGFDYV